MLLAANRIIHSFFSFIVMQFEVVMNGHFSVNHMMAVNPLTSICIQLGNYNQPYLWNSGITYYYSTYPDEVLMLS